MEVDNPARPEPMSDSHIDNVIEIMSSPVGTPMKRKSEESASREGKENGSMGKRSKTEEGERYRERNCCIAKACH
jgi:hypothetical protein